MVVDGKKLKKINKIKFNDLLQKKLGIHKIKNYYGLVEQIGSIFLNVNVGILFHLIFQKLL